MARQKSEPGTSWLESKPKASPTSLSPCPPSSLNVVSPKTTCPGYIGLMMGPVYFHPPSAANKNWNDQVPLPPKTYKDSTPTTGPGKQQAALLWPPQLSKQPLSALGCGTRLGPPPE